MASFGTTTRRRKLRDNSKTVTEVLCDDAKSALENFVGFRNVGHTDAWMEDVNGRPVSQKTLDPSRELMTDILQDTKQYLAESIRALADFRHGRVHGNVTREEAIEILKIA